MSEDVYLIYFLHDKDIIKDEPLWLDQLFLLVHYIKPHHIPDKDSKQECYLTTQRFSKSTKNRCPPAEDLILGENKLPSD